MYIYIYIYIKNPIDGRTAPFVLLNYCPPLHHQSHMLLFVALQHHGYSFHIPSC